MKAVLCTKYGPPEVLQLEDVPKPTPKKNEVCVKIVATAATASDCILRGAKIPLWNPIGLSVRLVLGFTKPRNPIIGMVLAGEVESVGADVTKFKQGDAVYGMTGIGFGTYAEYKCLSETECLVHKPARISYEEAAAVAYGGLLAGHSLKKANIQSGQKVLIYGASGAIGTTAVQLAKHLGVEVTGVCSTTNLALVKSLGADAVIDYTKEDLISRNERYDLILDAVGKNKRSALKAQCKAVLTEQGQYLSVDDGMAKSLPEYLVTVNELLETGHFQPVIDRCYPLEQIVEAHRYVDNGHKKGNVVITVSAKTQT
ncbi:MAG: NAD(P)-dependent alcohol dehydrogenase [Chloroflexota bacterium]